MKIIRFDSNDKEREVEIKIKLTEREYLNFDITKYRRFDDLRGDISRIAEADQVIEAVFRAFDYPLTMKEFVLNSKESGRVKKVAEVRRSIIYHLRKFTPLTITKIGSIFNLTHAMTIYHYGKYQDFLDVGDEEVTRINREVENILDNLN